MDELRNIMIKFANCNWDLISIPAKKWLNNDIDKAELVEVIKQADSECGNCGCEFDPLYKKALILLNK